jgi:hypothetical protein
MQSWKKDHAWAQQFVPHISQILGEAFVTEASLEQDMHENTDLLFQVKGESIAVRMRNVKEWAPFNRRNEWTIRTSRPSGMTTEVEKLLYGWGDYYFYGWGDDRDKRVKAYTILYLKPVRPWLWRNVSRLMQCQGQAQRNKDGSSSFLAINLDELPTTAIYRRKTELNDEQSRSPLASDAHRYYLDNTLTLAERQVQRQAPSQSCQTTFDWGNLR